MPASERRKSALLGMHRVGDIEGWEIPSRYLQFLHGGPADVLVDVVRHNDQDVRSLARLLVHLETQPRRPGRTSRGRLGRPGGAGPGLRPRAPPRRGARLPGRRDRSERVERRAGRPRSGSQPAKRRQAARTTVVVAATPGRLRWPSSATRRHSAARPGPRPSMPPGRRSGSRWIARTCSGGSGAGEAADGLGRGRGRAPAETRSSPRSSWPSSTSTSARPRRRAGRAVLRGFALIERRRRIGRPEPALEADLVRRHDRLRAARGAGPAAFDRLSVSSRSRGSGRRPLEPGEHGRPIRDAVQTGGLDDEGGRGRGERELVAGRRRADHPPAVRRTMAATSAARKTSPAPVGSTGRVRRDRGPARPSGSARRRSARISEPPS